MANKGNKDFIIKDDGTIVRSVTSSSKIEIFKKKITHSYDEVDNDDVDEDNAEVTICPVCYSDDIADDGSGILQYSCSNCGNIWGSRHDLECPECGSDDVEDDGSNCVQYKCNDCGYIWGDEEDDVNDEEEDEEDEEENGADENFRGNLRHA